MDAAFSLRLEELFFPVQEVCANPEHDLKGERSGTNLRHSFNVQSIEGKQGLFGVDFMIECDRDSSKNPPYFFQLQVYALLRTDAPSDLMAAVASAAFSVVVGAARERLLELTSRAPWGRFMMQPMQLVPQAAPQPPEPEK